MRNLPPSRQLPGMVEPPLRAIDVTEPSGTVSFRQIVGVVRRRYLLIAAMTLVGAAAGLFVASRAPVTYQAAAMLRVAGERSRLTGDPEAAPGLQRSADPMLSIIQLLRSRAVAGVVVDSLGLQLGSLTEDFHIEDLDQVHVDPRAAGDTVRLVFGPDSVTATRAERTVRTAYGQPVNLGTVQFSVRARPGVETALLGVTARETAIDWLTSTLLVTRREETDVIDVAFQADDPRSAQRIVNETVNAFQTQSVQWAREASRRRREFLAEQLAQTDSALARAQAELSSFRSRQQLASSRDKLAAEQASIFQLESRAAEIEADRRTFAALLAQLKSGDENSRSQALRALATSPAMADNPSVDRLYQQLVNYQIRIDSMTIGPWKASETNPDLVQLRALSKATQDNLVQAVSAHIGSLESRVNALGALRRSSGASIEVLPAMAEEEMRLTRRVDALAKSEDELRSEFQQARMAEAVEAGDIDVVALAHLPTSPLATGASLKLILGLVLGLMLGLMIAYVLEALNTSIRKPEDLEAVLHVPGLAVIPRISGGSRNGTSNFRRLIGAPGKGSKPAAGSPLSGGQTFSIGIEAFRNLRTSLIWSDGGEQLKTLVVTSAAPGEGKTLTAANLAVTLAYDGLRVLLVDCDIRRPRVHGLFHLPRAPGLMELLTAGDRPGGPPPAIRDTSISRLSVLPCGALPMNAANLLSSTRMRVLLEELKQQFDIIVLDTPPVLATADAGIVGSLTDGVLLVVRAGATDRNAAQRAYQQLANVGARVVGTVLNDPGGELAKEGDYYYPYDYAAHE